jgi:DNA polymerase-3 subunit gamma/tau
MATAPLASPAPRLQSFRDVAQLAESRREAMLHAHLLHDVHLVRFAPGMIELRPEPAAPRDLAAALGKMLLDATGERWTIALSREEGQPTLAQQGQAADTARRSAAAEHPLVRAILDAFPGASIDKVNDSRTDVYGLAPEVPLGEPEAGPPDTELEEDPYA